MWQTNAQQRSLDASGILRPFPRLTFQHRRPSTDDIVKAGRIASASRTKISTDNSTVSAWVIPTDEERMIARYTRVVLAD